MLDTRSDIYSLGATLWICSVARRPFGPLVGAVRDEPLPLEQLALAHVPEPVIALLRSMLAVEPEGRPASARELLPRSALPASHRQPIILVYLIVEALGSL